MAKVIKHKDAQSFLNHSEHYLQLNETKNNLLIGFANSIAKSQRELDGGELFYSIVHNDKIVGCAVRTNEQTPLSLTQIDKEFLPTLIKKLRSDKVHLIGINGEIQTIKNFVGFYGQKTKIHMHQGVYELTKVIPPSVEGCARLATLDDVPVAKEFLRGFLIDCFDEDSVDKAEKIIIRSITYGSVYLWFDSTVKPVAMAARTRDGKFGAAISLVYTPPEDRSKGYGKAVTAHCAQEILSSGKSICYLHTDMKNPISNLIYQKIGFDKICEFMHYDFIYESNSL